MFRNKSMKVDVFQRCCEILKAKPESFFGHNYDGSEMKYIKIDDPQQISDTSCKACNEKIETIKKLGTRINELLESNCQLKDEIIELLKGKSGQRRKPLLINAKIYDDIITYNRRKFGGDIVVHNCVIEEIGKHIREEIHKNEMVKDKGVTRYGNAYVLNPALSERRRVK